MQDIFNIEVTNTKESGASVSMISIARRLRLDKFIFSKKVQWREDLIALIAGELVYPGSCQFLVNLYRDTMLWNSCGHAKKRPDLIANVFHPLKKLLNRQQAVQKAFANRHLKNHKILIHLCNVPYPEEEGNLQFALFTDFKGFPIAIKGFSDTDSFRKSTLFFTNSTTSQPSPAFESYIVDQSLLFKKDLSMFHSTKKKKLLLKTSLPFLDFISLRMDLGLFNSYQSSSSLFSALFICMLSFYVQRYIEEKFEKHRSNKHQNKTHQLTLCEALEKLKSIRSQIVQIGTISTTQNTTLLDSEQKEILCALDLF